MLNNIKEKIKLHENDIFIVLVIILATVASIGALRLLLNKEEKPPITIEKNAFQAPITGDLEPGQLFMASKSGSKYYPQGCKAGNRIKAENRVYFASIIEAEKAGYELSALCSLASPTGGP